jgi:hypothetical protein
VLQQLREQMNPRRVQADLGTKSAECESEHREPPAKS